MHTPYALIGVTALAAGIAKVLAERGIPSLIIDRGSLPAAEFAESLHSRQPMYAFEPVTDAGKALKAELTDRCIASEKGDSLPALEPVFCNLLSQLHPTLSMLAGASVISDEVTENGCRRLEVYTIGGIVEVLADRVIDTTSYGRILSRTLNANLRCSTLPEAEGMEFVRGAFDDEIFMRMPVPSDNANDPAAFSADYTAARTSLLKWWRNRPESMRGDGLVHISDRFDCECEKGLILTAASRWSLPSESFNSALEAYDYGACLGANIEEVLK